MNMTTAPMVISNETGWIEVTVTEITSRSAQHSVQPPVGVPFTLINFGGFGDASATNSFSLYIVQIVVALLGILGNAFVLTVQCCCHQRQSSSLSPTAPVQSTHYAIEGIGEGLLRNQVTADLLTCVVLLLTTAINPGLYLATNNCNNTQVRNARWDDFKCRVFVTQLPLVSLYCVSSYNLCFITLHLAKVVLKSAASLQKQSRTAFFVTASWTIGIGLNAVFTLPTSGLVDGKICVEFGLFPNKTNRQIAGIVLSAAYTFVPNTIMLYLLTRMAWKLRALHRQISVGSSDGDHNLVAYTRLMAAVKIVAILDATLVLCGTANNMAVFLSFVDAVDEKLFETSLYGASVILLYFSCAVNPVIHALRDTRYSFFWNSITSHIYETTQRQQHIIEQESTGPSVGDASATSVTMLDNDVGVLGAGAASVTLRENGVHAVVPQIPACIAKLGDVYWSMPTTSADTTTVAVAWKESSV